ncbi:MAG: NAD(+) synthase [Candidatus Nanopelagicales bacterium]
MNSAGFADSLKQWLSDEVNRLGKKGALVQLSGGVDSSTVLMLCSQALGPENVIALYLPDSATGPETRSYVDLAAAAAGVEMVVRPIGAAIEAQQPLSEIDDLIRRYEPAYDSATQGYSVNVAPDLTRRLGALVYQVSIGPRRGRPERVLKMSVADLRALIAYQNRKQRTRMLFAYAEAESRNLAVVGASNGDELDTGFVVKYGDDAADLCPIGGISKQSVYELARALAVPEEIITRTPTTDTYLLTQTQEDYYYALPAEVLRRLAAEAEANRLDDDELAEIAASCPGWSTQALRQVGNGLAATLRYQNTRSLRFLDEASTRPD